MSPTPATVVEAITAVEFAMKVIHPETRVHARRLHAGFLAARDIDAETIAAHWNAVADRWPDDTHTHDPEYRLCQNAVKPAPAQYISSADNLSYVR